METGFSAERIKSAFEKINKQPFRSMHWKQQFTIVEFWTFVVLFFCLAISVASAFAFHCGMLSRNFAYPTSVISLAVAEIGFWMMGFLNTWSDFRRADQNVTERNRTTILSDVELMLFCKRLSVDEVNFLSKRFQLNAEQLRSRIAFLIGPIDKVGTVPLAISTIWALLKAPEITQSQMPLIITALSGLVLFYLAALVLTIRSHRIDECAQVLKIAASQSSTVDV